MTLSRTNRWTFLVVGIASLATFSCPGCNNVPSDPANADGGIVTHVNEETFEQTVLKADGRVLVDFYATWCPPCKALAPLIEEVARENPGVKIVKVDVDENPALASRYSVEGIPTLIVFENGQPITRQVGLVDKAEICKLLGI